MPESRPEFAADPAPNYERYFVPAVAAHLAEDLLRLAALKPGERVLDVACGTGVVARRAAERVGTSGTVAGLDVNPGMLAVARSAAPLGAAIAWHEAGAERMPLPDAAFDVVLCQLSLQFMPDKGAVLREMHRVLVPGGRVLVNVPGAPPAVFAILADALARHVSPEAGAFVNRVFSLADESAMQRLFEGAGFRDVVATTERKVLRVPPPADFLWQYLYCTPLLGTVARLDDERRGALEREVVAKWQAFVKEDGIELHLRPLFAAGRK